jgi:hypothetical protein
MRTITNELNEEPGNICESKKKREHFYISAIPTQQQQQKPIHFVL